MLTQHKHFTDHLHKNTLQFTYFASILTSTSSWLVSSSCRHAIWGKYTGLAAEHTHTHTVTTTITIIIIIIIITLLNYGSLTSRFSPSAPSLPFCVPVVAITAEVIWELIKDHCVITTLSQKSKWHFKFRGSSTSWLMCSKCRARYTDMLKIICCTLEPGTTSWQVLSVEDVK